MSESFITKDKYLRTIQPAIDLAISRNKKYGNTVDIVRTSSIIDLILMKLMRTRKLSTTDDKYLDELYDSLNYLVYILMRQ